MGMNIENVKKYLLLKEENEKILKRNEKDEIMSTLKSLHTIWKEHGVERVYLYGGFVSMCFNRYSDVDIAIEPEIGFEKLLLLYAEVSKYIMRELDLRLLCELPFSDKIKEIGLVIYERKNSDIGK